MMVQSIDHITINVKNLEASRAFYGELLGLAELSKVDMGDHVLTYYALPGGVKLELISYMSDTGGLHGQPFGARTVPPSGAPGGRPGDPGGTSWRLWRPRAAAAALGGAAGLYRNAGGRPQWL